MKDRILLPLTCIYLALSFGFAWICWGLCWLIVSHHLGLPLIGTAILGSFAPFISAGICVGLTGGPREALRFYARGFEWRMGWAVFAVSLLLMPAICVAAALIYASLTHTAFSFQMGWPDMAIAYIWLFFLGGPLGEEFGWSYLSDRLDRRFTPAFATLLLGAGWGFWHLPLFFLDVPGLTQRFIPFQLFLLNSIVLRFLFSWGYHKGNRNILANLIFHNGMNFGLSLVLIIPQMQEREHWRLWLVIILSAICTCILQRLAPARFTPPQMA